MLLVVLEIVRSEDETAMNETAAITGSGSVPGHVLRAFSHALELARAHEGATAPNPPVGCVLLDAAGQELAFGAHRRAGMPHAEVEAIVNAGSAITIHTVVVTLEPCNPSSCTTAKLAGGSQHDQKPTTHSNAGFCCG